MRADFTRHLTELDTVGRSAIVFLGSTIGNLDPRQRADFFAMTRAALRPGDVLLLGTDLVKPEEMLVPAYDDAAGVTAQFNLNVLRVLNSGSTATSRSRTSSTGRSGTRRPNGSRCGCGPSVR